MANRELKKMGAERIWEDLTPHGEEKCSGYARCRLGSKLIAPMQTRQDETRKNSDIVERILVHWKKGRVPDGNARGLDS